MFISFYNPTEKNMICHHAFDEKSSVLGMLKSGKLVLKHVSNSCYNVAKSAKIEPILFGLVRVGGAPPRGLNFNVFSSAPGFSTCRIFVRLFDCSMSDLTFRHRPATCGLPERAGVVSSKDSINGSIRDMDFHRSITAPASTR